MSEPIPIHASAKALRINDLNLVPSFPGRARPSPAVDIPRRTRSGRSRLTAVLPARSRDSEQGVQSRHCLGEGHPRARRSANTSRPPPTRVGPQIACVASNRPGQGARFEIQGTGGRRRPLQRMFAHAMASWARPVKPVDVGSFCLIAEVWSSLTAPAGSFHPCSTRSTARAGSPAAGAWSTASCR